MTLSAFKRDAASGKISLELLERYGDEIPEKMRGIRKISKVNTVGVSLVNEHGEESELRFGSAKLIDYDGKFLTVYEPGQREPTEEEKKVLDKWNAKAEKRLKENPFAEIYWTKKDYFANSSCPWMSGHETVKGKRYLYNGKVLDKSIRGKQILKYAVHTIYRPKKEMAEKELKSTKGSDYIKRSKAAEKLIERRENKQFNKAFTSTVRGVKTQCFSYMGYAAFAMKENLNIDTDPEERFNMENLIPWTFDGYQTAELDIGKIRTEAKLFKPKPKSNGKCLAEINGKFYDAKYLSFCFDIIGDCQTAYQNADGTMLYLENDNGIAIVMGCKIDPKRPSDCKFFSATLPNI